MDSLLSSTISPFTLLLDGTCGPVDAYFLLYHHLSMGLSRGSRTALLATCQLASHHRAVLRKLLGPDRSGNVSIVCIWEVCKRLGASMGDASIETEALGRALLGAAFGGAESGGSAPLCLCIESVQGVCEAAGVALEGLRVLEYLSSAIRNEGALLMRADPGCDWQVDPTGLPIAPSLCSALEDLSSVVVFAKDLPTGYSKDAHGRLEVWRRGEGGGLAGGLVYRVLPEGGVKEASVI